MTKQPTTAIELCARDIHAIKVYYRQCCAGSHDMQDLRILQVLENALAKLEGREPNEISEDA